MWGSLNGTRAEPHAAFTCGCRAGSTMAVQGLTSKSACWFKLSVPSAVPGLVRGFALVLKDQAALASRPRRDTGGSTWDQRPRSVGDGREDRRSQPPLICQPLTLR